MEQRWISLIEFSQISGVSVATIKLNYKSIPGIVKENKDFKVLYGSRYPYNIGSAKVNDEISRKCIILKAINKRRYLSCEKLHCYQEEMDVLLEELFECGLIQSNNIYEQTGINSYICTEKGARMADLKMKELKIEMAKLLGAFIGAAANAYFNS